MKPRGFTLPEMLVTLAIIATLMAGGAVYFIQAQRQSRDTIRSADLKTMEYALKAYYDDNAGYPERLDWVPLAELNLELAPQYIQSLPRDPLNKVGLPQEYWYVSAGGGAADNQCFCLVASMERAVSGNTSRCVDQGWLEGHLPEGQYLFGVACE